MLVSGTSTLVGIIGNPIVQVKSPGAMNQYFADHALNTVLVPMEIAPDAVPGFIAMVRSWTNCKGIIVTVPYKQVVAPLLDRLTPRAARFSTVNVFRRDPDGMLTGEMFDGVGFIAAAAGHGVDPAGERAAVVGAGGVACAIANSLCEHGISQLSIQDVDTAKQDTLIAKLRGAFPAIQIVAGVTSLAGLDILVNGTPVGMNGDPRLPLSDAVLAGLTARCFVADVVTAPTMTPFLALAKQRGCTVQTGIEMTETQLVPLAAFMGVAAP
jgi:shikimate dehydrogenase